MNLVAVEMNKILEEFVESEVLCNKSRHIYKELENILIRKDYLQNQDSLASQSGQEEVQDTATNSHHNLHKHRSTHRIKPNCSKNYINDKRRQRPTPPNNENCFALLQTQIHQFESYKNRVTQIRNKYASKFLSLLENQNEKLSVKRFETRSDSS